MTATMTYAEAKNALARRKIQTIGYTGLGHTGWHRFTTARGATVDVRRNPTTGNIETR